MHFAFNCYVLYLNEHNVWWPSTPQKLVVMLFFKSLVFWFGFHYRVADKWNYMGIDGEMTSNYSSVL